MSNKVMPFYNRERAKLGEVLPLESPFTVIIDTSEVCNFKCNYCFRASSDVSCDTYGKKESLMKWDTFVKVVDQIKMFPNQNIKRISLSGHGEPLCNRKLPQMVKYIKDSGLIGVTEIHTNASMLMDSDFCKELAHSGIDKVIISLQGINAQSYKEVADVDIHFDSFLNGLKTFYHEKKDTIVNIKIADISLKNGEEEKFYEIFSSFSDRLFVEKIVPLFNGVNYSQIIDDKKGNVNKYGQNFKEQKICTQVFYTLLISPEGEIYPCAQLEAPFSMGNVNETTLVEAWNSEKRTTFLKRNLKCGFKNINKCDECYIPYNTIKVKEDLVDDYSEKILDRMSKQGI